MTKKQTNIKAYICLFLSSLLVGFTFLVVKQCATGTTPLQTLFFRFVSALVIMGLMAAVRLIKIELKAKGKLFRLFAAGALFVSSIGIQTYGLMYTTSVVSGIIYACIPVFSAIMAGIFLKEKTNALQNIFLILSVVAVMAVTAGGSIFEQEFSLTGVILLVVSALCLSAYSVVIRSVKGLYSPYEISFSNSLVGAVAFAVMAVLSNGVSPAEWGEFVAPMLKGDFIISILYLSVGCTIISCALQGYAYRFVSAVQVTIWSNVSSVISFVAGVFILGEAFEPYKMICSAVIIASVICINLFAGKKKKG